MKREHYSWYSSNLNRNMDLLTFGHSGANVLVFPTRVGRFFDYENWGLVRSVEDKIEKGYIKLICVDSVDEESFYCNWNDPKDRIHRHQQYENYIIDEVFPFMREHNPSEYTISHGCSLGAYHAMNIALRHPEKFNKIVALSGRYDLTIDTGNHRNLFDGHYDEHIYFHMPLHFIAGITDEALLEKIRKLEIIFTIGQEDQFLSNNQAFSQVLNEKDINHQLYIWSEEAHRARYWREQVKIYL